MPQNPCQFGSSFLQVKDDGDVKNSMVSIIYSVVFISGFGAPVNGAGTQVFFEKNNFKLSLHKGII